MGAKMRCKCGYEFVVEARHRGKKVHCPGCGKARGVPAKLNENRTLPIVPRLFLGYMLWPLFVGGHLYFAYWGDANGVDFKTRAIITAVPILVILSTLEWLFPHRERWSWKDGQTRQNLLHSFISPLAALFLAAEVIGGFVWPFVQYVHNDLGIMLWPRDWPLAVQIVLMVAVWDFFGYWAHRWSHEWGWLWRLHGMHHDQPTLHAVNAGRIHILDTLKTEATVLPILLILGCPGGIIAWYVTFFRALGVLSHTNLPIRMGVFNYVFNTPENHRYHHSSVLEEEHSNYGQNFMIWDVLFGTYTKPDTVGPRTLGAETPVPKGFFGQVLSPLVWDRASRGKRGGKAALQPAAATTLS